MVNNMAFERKWVSESNLDKLWNETIEKKQANKQRRSPDFCKEAILSATLKRISSEMIMRRMSSPMLDIDINSDSDSDDDDEDNSIMLLSSISMKTECFQDDECNDVSSSDEKTFTTLSTNNASKSSNVCFNGDNKLMDNCNGEPSVEMSDDISSDIGSPKRKRSDLDDDDSLIQCSASPVLQNRCSPAKRQRYKNGMHTRSTSRSLSPRRTRKRSQSPARRSSSIKNLTSSSNFAPELPKLKIIHSEDNQQNISSKSHINAALLSPVRSMVNSISELSLGVNEQWQPSASGSWCMPIAEQKHKDPLELDGFFHKLKKVTS